MNMILAKRQFQLVLGAALLACASAASAQWMWVDAKGVKQFSDRAPPASVPLKSILKSPGGAAVEREADTASTAATMSSEPKAPPSLAEREAAYRKQKAEKAEIDKKMASMAANEEQRRIACDAAVASRAQLDSGVRLRSADKVWLDANMRAEQSATVNSILEQCRR